MKIHLDERRCEGFGFCEEEAPHLVALNDNGDLVVLFDGTLDMVDAAVAQKAVRSCPVAALQLLGSQAS